MDLISIISRFEDAVSKFENTNSQIEKEHSEFDKTLGITKEQHNEVIGLIDSYEDSEDAITQLTNQIKALNNEISNLEGQITSGGLSDEEKNLKLVEIQSKRDRSYRLEDSKNKAKQTKGRSEKKLKDKFGITDMTSAKGAKNTMQTKIAALPKGGGVATALKYIKANPYVMAVQMLVKAVEFGIGKATEYMKLEYQNVIRELNAVTTVSLNGMRANFASWQDAVNGAYEAQEMAIASQLAMMEAHNATTLANLKMQNTWTNCIPILGEINKYNEAALEMEQQLAQTRLSSAQKIIQQVNTFTKKTDEYIKKQDKAIHAHQVERGMSVQQTEVFETRMLSQAEEFAKINKTIEDVLKLQSVFTEQSGRAVNFSDNDYLQTAAVGRLVGDDNISNFQAQMQVFNHSVSDAADIMYEMYKDVNKMGLSQKKVTKDVLANLKLADKYDFKNGVKGFIEMSKWAENVKFNMGSLGGMLEKGQSGGLEGVITQAAKLQVLGGNLSMGADPLGMAWEMHNSPEDYGKRVHSMFKGMGVTDQTTGETHFNMADTQRIRAAAEALGMSTEDAKNMIREEGKKEIVRKQMSTSTLTKKQQDAVANKAQRDEETGRWYVNTVGGEKIDVSKVQAGDIQNILSADNDEAALQYAQSTMSLTEKIEATTKQIDAKLGALTFANFAQLSEEQMNASLEAYGKYSAEVQSAIEANRYDALEAQKRMLDSLKDINGEYMEAKTITETQGKQRSYDIGEDLRSKFRRGEALDNDIEQLKIHPEYRIGMSLDEMKKLRKTDTRRGLENWIDWHRDSDWVAGEEGDTATDYRAIPRVESQKMVSEGYAAIGALPFKDGVSVANGTPMAVAANKVVPVQDGTATIAKSDPKDSAIFAKTGGPFDTLFNGIFDKINDVYGFMTDAKTIGVRHKVSTIQPRSVPYSNEAPVTSIPSDSNGFMQTRNEAAPAENSLHKGSFDINIHGDLNLRSNGQSIDIMQELKNDPILLRSITQMISDSISSKIHGGKSIFNGNDMTYFGK